MAKSSLADRLYRGDANLNIIGRRKIWFIAAAVLVLIAFGGFLTRGFHLGIEFAGGTSFTIPAEAQGRPLAQDTVADAVERAITQIDPAAEMGAVQKVGGAGQEESFTVRASALEPVQAEQAKTAVATELGVPTAEISDNQVSAAWGGQVTRQALLGLAIFLVLVTLYLVIRFEWRMAVAAVASLMLDLLLTAGVYALVAFEVTPSTVIGFLTILGFALYDTVVVFDKVQENTRGITAGSTRTYAEATNLAVNQTLMRSINTSLVALLPVGGLLFIGAGLLGAGTLKDLGLVLFVGMAFAVLSSLLFAAPFLVTLKEHEPRIKSHNARVLARRTSARSGDVAPRGERKRAAAGSTAVEPEDVPAAAGAGPALAASAPRPGVRPPANRTTNRGGRPGGAGNRPSGGKKRR